ncbi:MAG TPA: carbamate kinase [Bdellovibrionota bacterium]|nr:carbamate kinase [Bdellovibrionota bacterium]
MTKEKKPRVLIAFGGNAIAIRGHEKVHQKEEFIVARKSMESVVDIFQKGYNKIVITHGNGPQVGRIFLQQELTKDEFPRQVTLDVCVADSQGRIGYILQNVFDNICVERGIRKKTSTVITQVVVDPNDSAFNNPTKPIGVFYTKEEAEKLIAERKWIMKEDAGRGWRRVVPSPKPIEIVEKSIFVELLDIDFTPIGVGGGGVPVTRKEDGELRGVEAVIDKDLSSALLASVIGIDTFIILTEVNHAYLDFKTSNQKPIFSATVTEMEEFMKQGHFAEGSMRPKVQAATNFLKSGGSRAIIANLYELLPALEGETGTQILPD